MGALKDAILALTPLVYYDFDTPSGTTLTNLGSAGSARNGTISGSYSLAQPPLTADGGYSIAFTNGKIVVGIGLFLGDRITSVVFGSFPVPQQRQPPRLKCSSPEYTAW